MDVNQDLDLENPPFPLTEIDRKILSTRDEDAKLISWSDLERIIKKNTLEELKRRPSDLHRYLRWSHKTKSEYTSITNFVVKERLRWKPNHEVTANTPLTAASFSHHAATPFADMRDYTILRNDWPYAFTPDITHLLVWSRTPIDVDDDRGDVTAESRRLIEDFVHASFVKPLAIDQDINEDRAAEQVQWFKNWVSLQSVRGIDHIHVLVKDASDNLIKMWTK